MVMSFMVVFVVLVTLFLLFLWFQLQLNYATLAINRSYSCQCCVNLRFALLTYLIRVEVGRFVLFM